MRTLRSLSLSPSVTSVTSVTSRCAVAFEPPRARSLSFTEALSTDARESSQNGGMMPMPLRTGSLISASSRIVPFCRTSFTQETECISFPDPPRRMGRRYLTVRFRVGPGKPQVPAVIPRTASKADATAPPCARFGGGPAHEGENLTRPYRVRPGAELDAADLLPGFSRKSFRERESARVVVRGHSAA